jgi:hypothetical protein
MIFGPIDPFNLFGKSESQKIIEQAEGIIERAKKKYERERARTEKHLAETDRFVAAHRDYKLNLLKDLKTVHSPIINRFKDFRMYSEVYSSGKIGNFDVTDLSQSISSPLSGMMGGPLISIIFEYFQKEKAKEFLAEAKEYRAEVDLAVVKMEQMVAKSEGLRRVLQDEFQIVERMVTRLKDATSFLHDLMKRTHITEEDRTRAEFSFQFSEWLTDSLRLNMLKDDFTIQTQYEKHLAKLRTLETQLGE